MTLDEASSQELLAGVLAVANRLAPGADVWVRLESGRAANTRFAIRGITSTGDVTENTLTIALAFGRRRAQTATNQLDPHSVEEAIVRLRTMARLTPEDPEYMPTLGPQTYSSVPNAYDPILDRLGAPERADGAKNSLVAARKAGVHIAGFIYHETAFQALASSAGLSAHHLATTASFTATARTPDGTGSGWGIASGNRWRDIDIDAVAGIAIDKAVRSQNVRALPPGRYTVVLEPAAVAGLLYFLTDSLDARRADEGRSFFSSTGGGNKVGERLFGEHVTLSSDPTRAETPGSPFDVEGLPLRSVTWIDRGKLAALAYTRYWAAKQGKKPTGAPSGYELTGSDGNAADLLRGVKKGILITRFWYTRWLDQQTMMVTGLTRDGVFLIENGVVTTPVNNFRFNESPVNMLARADVFTRKTTQIYDIRVPALRTHDFNLASVSKAV
ncbi:MAG TPA: TldD/PmbA family protein [Terriglobales bacterium]